MFLNRANVVSNTNQTIPNIFVDKEKKIKIFQKYFNYFAEIIEKIAAIPLFIFQLMIAIVTYKILGFILLFFWFISNPQSMCHDLLVSHYIIYFNLFISLFYGL